MNKAQKIASMAVGAWKGVKMLKGIVNSELHRFEQAALSLAPATGTGTVNNLTNIAAGDDNNNRTGNSILAKYLYLRGTVTMASAATTTFARLDVIVDTSQQGTLPTASQIYNTATVRGFINGDETTRFRTIFTHQWEMDDNNRQGAIFKYYIPLNFHVKYSGTANTDIKENQVLLVLTSSEATNTPTFLIDARICFYDN